MFLDMTEAQQTATVIVFPDTHCDGWQARQIGFLIQGILAELVAPSARKRGAAERVSVLSLRRCPPRVPDEGCHLTLANSPLRRSAAAV